MPYTLVSPDKIPLAEDVAEDKLIEAYKIATALSILCVKERGVGLSAVQAGIPLKIFVVKNDLTNENYLSGFSHYVNCRYEPVGYDIYESYEGCLSLRDKFGELRSFIVPRYNTIRFVGKKIVATNPLHFAEVDITITQEQGAAVYAHETDHSYGTTIDKIGEEVIVKRKN